MSEIWIGNNLVWFASGTVSILLTNLGRVAFESGRPSYGVWSVWAYTLRFKAYSSSLGSALVWFEVPEDIRLLILRLMHLFSCRCSNFFHSLSAYHSYGSFIKIKAMSIFAFTFRVYYHCGWNCLISAVNSSGSIYQNTLWIFRPGL